MKKNVLFAGKVRKICLAFLLSTLFAPCAFSQYFGRNKVNYEKFPFEVLESPHFKIYHYVADKSSLHWFAKSTEQWYRMHQSVFTDTFKRKNPIILYNTHSGFQQTNVIESIIGAGTGGVTEGLKNRVVMPFFESRAQTDHVLGHELVHAFQYHMVLSSDSLSLGSLGNLPLWMVEGLAEYMSIGTHDPLTALWLRSAVLNDRLPTLKDLTNKPDLYFPYRWGQAFWAFVTGIYGDKIIKPLFLNTAKVGYKDAVKRVLGLDEKAFSEKWQQAIRNAYSPFKVNTSITAVGKEIINRQNAGRLNIVPSISPDGNLLAFWTEKDLFNIDLYLADAETGETIKKLTSRSFSSHVDEYNSFESSVAWSPDSKQIAFVAFSKGKNQLLIVDLDGKIVEEISLPGISGFSNPAWSPDGRKIVVSALANGQSDLYAFDLRTKTLDQLTDDSFSDLLPSWSPDGKWIAFSSDRLGTNKTVQHKYSHDISLYNVATRKVQSLELFEGANNLNPVFGNDNRTIYFLSDQDGFRNLYSVDIQTGNVSRLSNLFTGITGITLYGPAISVSGKTGQIVYSYYTGDGDYNIYSAKNSDFTEQSMGSTTQPMASMLPPFERSGRDIVQNNIENAPYPLVDESTLIGYPYRAKLQLEYLSNSGGVGVATGSGFGPGVGGGVNGIFSDVLGNHQLFGSLAINGEVYDFGGQFAYLNRNNRINWGVGVSHIPYTSGLQRIFPDSLVLNNGDTIDVINSSIDLLRTYQEQIFLFGSYPFSQTRRLEAGGSFARYHYRLDRYTDYYTLDGVFIGNERNKLPVPKGFNFGQVYLAYVGDNSQFGVASPLTGHRYRFEAGQYFGVANMQTGLADYRKYFRAKPFTIAFRNMFVGRFGKEAESGVIPPFYIGDPYFIRGYQALDFATKSSESELTVNDLLGSKIFITNAELRFPFTGPERLSAIRSRILFTELNLFTDGGIAWGSPSTPAGNGNGNIVARNSKFILSSGISLRLNFFGYLVIEPYYAVPWQNGGFSNANFGLNFISGW